MTAEDFISFVKTNKDDIERIARESVATERNTLREFFKRATNMSSLACKYLSGYLLCALQPKSTHITRDTQDNTAALMIGTGDRKKSTVYEQAVLYEWGDDELDSMETAKEAFMISLKHQELSFIADSYWKLVEAKF